ncbi:MAG: single-stranded-DNA-specific exonuclease RecJ [Gammaproteobacteria bacterium]
MTPSIKRRAAGTISIGAELSPLLQRIFAGRGIDSAAEIDPSLSRLIPSGHLSGIENACELLGQALSSQQRILIVADFDADGATSCAVAVRGLRAMGAKHVDYLVPNRFEYGYGLTPEIVAMAAKKQPDLIVTVDNGISSIAGVEAARATGIAVLITDHHLPGAELPAADAIVNPNLPGDQFASKALAGVGVMFYVLMALRAVLRGNGWFAAQGIPEPNLAALLDLVALGTIADVVAMDANNRILAEQGLRRIRAGKTVAGIAALIQVAGANQRTISSTDLAFLLGPRLNAAGRLADMTLGIECLISDSETHCLELAYKLDQLNRERREIEKEMKDQAVAHVNAISIDDRELPAALSLFNPGWHQGVVGIVASRIKDQCHRPVIAFATDGVGGLKGSGRSIPGLHLRDLLDSIASHNPELLSKFGGHAMAAGLTIDEADYEKFSEVFALTAASLMNDTMLQKTIETDGGLGDDHFDLELAQTLKIAAPWGQAFPAPIFDDEFEIVEKRIVGESHVKLKLRLLTGTRVVQAIAFNAVEQAWVDARNIRAVYRLDVNEFRDNVSVQLLLEHATTI